MKINLEKGKGQVKITVPDEKIIQVVEGRELPAMDISQIKEIIRAGIRQSSPANLAEKNIVIIVPDNTRLWARGDLFVPVIVETLQERGASLDHITILIALGTHSDLPADMFPALVGQTIAEKLKILNSANKDQSRLVTIGTTDYGTVVSITREACEADHIIVLGGLLHHMVAGYGGGRKYILPGIAGYDSIQQNHSLAFLPDGTPHPKVKQGSLKGNPIAEDMQAAAEMFLAEKTSTFVAVAANGKGEIFHAQVGDIFQIFAEGCHQVNRACSVPITEKGDFALISAGGYRTDGQLYQATKALFNAVNAVKKNGKILFVAEAAEGIGNPEFGNVLSEYKNNPAVIGKKLLQKFSMPAYVAYRVANLLNRYQITLVSSYSRPETESYGFNYADDLQTYIQSLEGRGYIIPFAENILPIVG